MTPSNFVTSSNSSTDGHASKGHKAMLNLETYVMDLMRQVVREELASARAAPVEEPKEKLTAELLTVEQVAESCHVGPGAVRGWIRTGRLTASKVGRGYLIEPAALRRLLSGLSLVQAAPEPDEEARRILGRIQGGM